MFRCKKSDYQCDFGQYEELWKNHKNSCKIIVRITSDYIVYIDNKNNIDWETTEASDSKKSTEDNSVNEKALSQCLITERKPTVGLSEESILSFKNIVGEAIVNCLERNYDSSIEILKQADEFRIDRVIEKSRGWYLSYSVILSVILISIVLLINIKNIAILDNMLPYIDVGAWAIAGACLSIILRSGHLQHASYAGKQLHFIESGCRLLAGFISGQIVYVGIKSGILFSGLVTPNNSQYVISLLALLAGASERFAPSIITKIEESTLINEVTKENQK